MYNKFNIPNIKHLKRKDGMLLYLIMKGNLIMSSSKTSKAISAVNELIINKLSQSIKPKKEGIPVVELGLSKEASQAEMNLLLYEIEF